jgi:hypothetical protein
MEVSPMTPTGRSFKVQCDIRFAFFLLGLAACACSICFLLGRNNWALAPSLFIDGLVFWTTRGRRYSVLPGLIIGFIVGIVLNLAVTPADIMATGLWCATFGVLINAICIGYWRTGLFALIGVIASSYVMVSILSRLS